MQRLALLCFLSSLLFGQGIDTTALDRYVAAPDPAYRVETVRTIPGLGFTVHVLSLTSQNWLTTAEVNRTEWRHWLTIVRPTRVRYRTGVLFIDGGSNTSNAPGAAEAALIAGALETGAVFASLRMVPNQPLRFAGENRDRTEDALIAYTWDKFLRTGDERWPARLPMTKAAVRAMDAVTEFLARPEGGENWVDRFIVSGASKRGWTAWTTAAVDARVVAVAPMVIDMLNMEPSFIHHWRSYGFWAPAVKDYVEMGIMNWIGTPQMEALLRIEEPFQYRDRLALPKYIINSSGDQFFLPDSSRFYWDDLQGEKYIRYAPNTDHGLGRPDVATGLLAWVKAILEGTPRPRFTWRTSREHGLIRLRALDEPLTVTLWQATNPKARDFRLEAIGPAWRSSRVDAKDGIYEVQVPKPAQGWTAFFLEVTFPGEGAMPLIFSTEVAVIPDEYPFGPPK